MNHFLPRSLRGIRGDSLVVALVLVMVTEPAFGAKAVVELTWAGFRQQLVPYKLIGRGVKVFLSDGTKVSSVLRKVEEDALVVDTIPNTAKQWSETGRETRIPRAQVSSLRFAGRAGHGGLIGGLVGLGAGGALVGGMAAAMPTAEGSSFAGALLLVPILAVSGYFIGRLHDKPIPEFRIVQ